MLKLVLSSTKTPNRCKKRGRMNLENVIIFHVFVFATIICDKFIDARHATTTGLSDQPRLGPHAHYTDQWAAYIDGGEKQAKEVARRHGFVYIAKVFDGYYLFRHHKIARRSVNSSSDVNEILDFIKEPQVLWAEQQVAKKRVKRDIYSDVRPDSLRDSHGTERRNSYADRGKGFHKDVRKEQFTDRERAIRSALKGGDIHNAFSDPKWPRMWYLNRGRGLDMNVMPAWRKGYTGRGVVVSILDDGIEKDHPDIKSNYDAGASYDVNDHDNDPQPRYEYSNENRHGTRCAGEVAAEANNGICSAGVAFEASIGGVRMLDGDVTDAVEAQSLSLNPQHIHIYSASWGPDDDGQTVDGPGPLARKAFHDGIANGRGGRGSIFVWASGNGGRDSDSCNCDGYTNSIYTLSMSSATEHGQVPWYSEACSSTLATTYSSGSGSERQIVTTDLRKGCTETHTGTSASAPLAAGICALVLQANPYLTWRDMQHLVVLTSRQANLEADDWVTNGVGRRVSHHFGYGLLDVAMMVDLARNWTNVPEQHRCEITSRQTARGILINGAVEVTLESDGCRYRVTYLEHVQAVITLASSRRGEVEVFLTSPQGTRSTLLARRSRDASTEGFNAWAFMTTHSWGETAIGTWRLEVRNGDSVSTLKNWTLIMYGTATASPGATHRNIDPRSTIERYPWPDKQTLSHSRGGVVAAGAAFFPQSCSLHLLLACFTSAIILVSHKLFHSSIESVLLHQPQSTYCVQGSV